MDNNFACLYQQSVYQLDAITYTSIIMPTKLWHIVMQYVIKYELNLFILKQVFT